MAQPTRLSCLLLVLILAGYTLATAHYAAVWRSDLTLWRHAVAWAPLKPRPAHNYGMALIVGGTGESGLWWIDRAQRLARQPWVPEWDRADMDAVLDGRWRP